MDFTLRTPLLLLLLLLHLGSLLPLRDAKATSFGHGNVTVSGLRGRKQISSCNIFQGKWVVDASYPLYDSGSCPYIDTEFDCQKYGRPDSQYLKYSWKPDACDLPRFNGVEFLSKWRGKKIMFVGDSLSLNMWQSLACMIYSSVPDVKAKFVKGSYVTFQVLVTSSVTSKLDFVCESRTLHLT